jgi:hypothetical protein
MNLFIAVHYWDHPRALHRDGEPWWNGIETRKPVPPVPNFKKFCGVVSGWVEWTAMTGRGDRRSVVQRAVAI